MIFYISFLYVYPLQAFATITSSSTTYVVGTHTYIVFTNACDMDLALWGAGGGGGDANNNGGGGGGGGAFASSSPTTSAFDPGTSHILANIRLQPAALVPASARRHRRSRNAHSVFRA